MSGASSQVHETDTVWRWLVWSWRWLGDLYHLLLYGGGCALVVLAFSLVTVLSLGFVRAIPVAPATTLAATVTLWVVFLAFPKHREGLDPIRTWAVFGSYVTLYLGFWWLVWLLLGRQLLWLRELLRPILT